MKTPAQDTPGAGAKPPNFVVFLTDDLGYGDLGCQGATDLRTPRIDALAASGARLTNWYSNSPVCSPSRAALLTGRYPANAGVRSILGGRRTEPGLPAAAATLATALKDLGYRTGLTGKWHLGGDEPCRPHRHGFDEWFGFLAGCVDYYSHIFYWGQGGSLNPCHDLWENNVEVFEDGRYLTELIAERALAFVRRAAAQEQPFFLYVPFNAVHYPMHAPTKYLERFPDLPWERRIYAAMLSAVDDSVGSILDELKARGVLHNTCVVFTSDNGPSREARNWMDGRTEAYYGGSAGPLKGHKFSLFEGGIRVPGIISWPARIPAGQILDGVGANMDLFPTFLKAAGGDPSAYDLDGLDILPMAAQATPSPHGDIFWELGNQTALRRGPWKLVLHGELQDGTGDEAGVFLSNLDDDPGEQTNLAARQPELARELKSAAEAWRAEIEIRSKKFAATATSR